MLFQENISNGDNEINGEQRPFKIIFRVVFILILIASSGYFVFLTGGIRYVYSHSMYIAIILAAYYFFEIGGLITGLLAGLVLGPYMPLNVATGEMQVLTNWLFRTIIFSFIGTLSGCLFHNNKKQLDRIHWMVYHEIDTGIPNRSALIKYLNKRISNRPCNKEIVLFTVLLNNYKEITGILDIDEVNKLTSEIYDRLQPLIQNEITYQLFPYVFCVVLEKEEGEIICQKIADKIIEEIKKPIKINHIPIYADVSIGAALLFPHDKEALALLRRAKIAAQIASEKELSFWLYSPKTDTKVRKSKVLVGEISDALANQQICLHYQPIINVINDRVESLEALIRWYHPIHGYIKPMQFLPTLERTALIQDVHHWVYQEALKAVLRLDDYEGLISINLSTRLLLNRRWISDFRSFIKDIDFNPQRIVFEVTETSIMKEVEESQISLSRLKNIGVNLALDDFGTGYSSLGYLQKLPIDILKIDRTLIKGIHNNTKNQMIVNSILTLSKSMGFRTIAEGIENQIEYDWLLKMGCKCIQGFLISKPLSESKLQNWLKNRK